MLAGIVLQAFATPKPSHRTATWYSVIHDPKSHISSCPLSSGIALYTTLVGEMFGLWAAARLWNPIPFHSRCTVIVLAGQFVALQTHGWLFHPISSKFHELPSSTLSGPCWSLNAAYPIVVSLWLCLHISTSQSRHHPSTLATWERLQCPWQISYWCGNRKLVHIRSQWAPLTYPCCRYCLVMSKARISMT
jgi:hypothetical protein